MDCATMSGRVYYLGDANFNVTTLVNTGGNALERYVYSPYGVLTIYDATWANLIDLQLRQCVYLYRQTVGRGDRIILLPGPLLCGPAGEVRQQGSDWVSRYSVERVRIYPFQSRRNTDPQGLLADDAVLKDTEHCKVILFAGHIVPFPLPSFWSRHVFGPSAIVLCGRVFLAVLPTAPTMPRRTTGLCGSWSRRLLCT